MGGWRVGGVGWGGASAAGRRRAACAPRVPAPLLHQRAAWGGEASCPTPPHNGQRMWLLGRGTCSRSPPARCARDRYCITRPPPPRWLAYCDRTRLHQRNSGAEAVAATARLNARRVPCAGASTRGPWARQLHRVSGNALGEQGGGTGCGVSCSRHESSAPRMLRRTGRGGGGPRAPARRFAPRARAQQRHRMPLAAATPGARGQRGCLPLCRRWLRRAWQLPARLNCRALPRAAGLAAPCPTCQGCRASTAQP